MGPQLDSCGRSDCSFDRLASSALLQWGRNLTVAEGMNVRDWIAENNPPLQWGRNLTVAEGVQLVCRARAERDASMGPQLDSCGRVYRVGMA